MSDLQGIRSSAAWLGLDANPVVHGHVDDSFVTDALAGSLKGEYITQDRVTVLRGRLPHSDATDEIALTIGIARLFGVAWEAMSPTSSKTPKWSRPSSTAMPPIGSSALCELPPVLVDQFDQTQGAVLPQAAAAAAAAVSKSPSPFRGWGCG